MTDPSLKAHDLMQVAENHFCYFLPDSSIELNMGPILGRPYNAAVDIPATYNPSRTRPVLSTTNFSESLE